MPARFISKTTKQKATVSPHLFILLCTSLYSSGITLKRVDGKNASKTEVEGGESVWEMEGESAVEPEIQGDVCSHHPPPSPLPHFYRSQQSYSKTYHVSPLTKTGRKRGEL